MDLQCCAERLNLPRALTDFYAATGWDEAAARGRTPELDDEYLARALARLRRGIPEPETVFETARTIRRDPALSALLNYLIYYWHDRPDVPVTGVRLRELGSVPAIAPLAGQLALLLTLSGFERVAKAYARLGLPPICVEDVLDRYTDDVEQYRRCHNRQIGLELGIQHWLRHYINGQVFRLGRFEFQIREPGGSFLPAAYRRKADGRVVALCRNGWQLTAEGLCPRLNDCGTSVFQATLEQHGRQVTGTPISPDGYAEIHRRVTLHESEWDPLWLTWDLVPGVHIPSGGRMTPELATESFRKAMVFFPKYLRREVKAFSCGSWIFNPDFRTELPQSHLAWLMNQVYLFPEPSEDDAGLRFVFASDDGDWSKYPADNSLRKAFHRIHASGRRLKEGGMFLEPRGLERFGEEVYRREYPTLF